MINTEREGVSAIQSIVYKELGWLFREQTVDDFGIDAEIEVANQKYPTGKVIAVQIKSGASYFIDTTEEGVIFRFDERHKEYWLKHTLPAIILLYHPVSQECIWENINKFTAIKVSDKGYKIVIPKENRFGMYTKIRLLIIAYGKNIENLAEEIDDLNVNTESVFAMLDDEQKRIFISARKEFDKKNVSSDRNPFEFNREELSNFVGTIKWQDIKDDLIVGNQFINLVHYIDNFICSAKTNTLIILGEAGTGKTTLVKTVIKHRDSNDILYIRVSRLGDCLLDDVRSGYEINNSIKVVILDGWEMLDINQRFNTWYKIVDWQNYHKNIKLIITTRYIENQIWKNADILNIFPLSQVEALAFLKSMMGESLIITESLEALVKIYNTPLLLKLLLMSTRQLGLSLEEATSDKLLFSFISQYSEEESDLFENIAFRMMKENKISITVSDDRYLEELGKCKELHIEKTQISFGHKIIYELFAAKYIFRNIFTEYNDSQAFGIAVWDIFANNICSLEILDYVKILIKYERNNNLLEMLNNNFSYMLERGMLIGTLSDTEIFKEISNVFYTIWHLVSFTNRIYNGGFKLTISNNGEKNLSCLINIFNKIYFGEKYLDFSHTDFSNIKLWRCNLINMNFKKSILCHTNFLGSCLEGSNFEQADLSNTNLIGADLRHTNLKDVNLTGANVSKCMISENSLKYVLPYKDTLLHLEKLIIFMDDGTIKYFFD